ncbi:MAG: HAD hydrolase-like protein [bacterium]
MKRHRNSFQKINTILFDSDGVITTEREYWLAAELTILELLYGEQWIGLNDNGLRVILYKPGAPVILGKLVNRDFSESLKIRGINSNWDLTYFSCALYLIEIFKLIHDKNKLTDLLTSGFAEETFKKIGDALTKRTIEITSLDKITEDFFQASDRLKLESTEEGKNYTDKRFLTAALNERLKIQCGIEMPVFSGNDDLWHICQTLFQEWYLGDNLLERLQKKKLSKISKAGLIEYEMPIIPTGRIMEIFSMLKEANIIIGIATGRPYEELITPLKRWGLLNFFDLSRIATHREVQRAELLLKGSGNSKSLSKPNPYIYLKALFPDKRPEEILEMRLPLENGDTVLVVGDSASDILAAKQMGAQSAVVLSEVKNPDTVAGLKGLEPDYVLKDVNGLKELF